MSVKRVSLIVLIAIAVVLVVGAVPRIAGTGQALSPAQEPDSSDAIVSQPGDLDDEVGPRVADEIEYSTKGRLATSATAPATSVPHLGGEIVISALENEQYLPAVAYNWKHNEYLVVWHNKWGGGGRDIYAQRITSGGELKSWFAVTAGPNDRAQPSVAYDPVNDRYLVVWIYDVWGDGSDWDVYGRFIPWNGPSASLPEFSICTWATKQWNPKVAYARAQEEFLVVWWTEHPSVPAYVSGRRVFADGSGFPPGDGFTIAVHATENRVSPDVAYNLARNEYLVTCDNAFDIYAVRLRGDGVALGGGEFGVAGWPDTEIRPVVAACDAADQYLVAWQSLQPAGHYDLYARFVTGDGTPDSVHLIYDTPVGEVEPDIACNLNGRQYLVVWQEQYSSAVGPYGVWGRLVYPDRSMGAAFGIIAPIGGITAEFTNPAVAGGHTNYLVAWEHDRAGTSYQDIHGQLISPYAVFLPLVVRNFQ